MTIISKETNEELTNPHIRFHTKRDEYWCAVSLQEYATIPQDRLYRTMDDAARGRKEPTITNPEGMCWEGIVRVVYTVGDTNYTPWEREDERSVSFVRPPLEQRTMGFVHVDDLKPSLPKCAASLTKHSH